MMLQRHWSAICLLLCTACAGAGVPALPPTSAQPAVSLPPESARYTTDVTPNGIVGGERAEQLAREVNTELQRRGSTKAVADGVLASAAGWILRELVAGRAVDQARSDAAARRFGFAGVVLSMAGFDLGGSAALWKDALARVPGNMTVNRYGVCISADGNSAVVVFGNVDLQLEPFARHLAANDSIELRGVVGERYTFSHVYLNRPDGNIDEQRMPTRSVAAKFALGQAGRYKLEVMGDGPTGPVILANVPLYVGVPEPDLVASVGRAVSPAEGEQRMLELLNDARSKGGLQALQADNSLRDVAAGHSNDMAEHDFFGHVSPTTGDAEARVLRSGITASRFGENVAQSDTPESAFESLMASPGHRANMLSPQYTHVGIAAARAREGLVFTLVFARLATAQSVPQTAAQVESAFLALRAQKGLKAPAADDVYRIAAEAGLKALLETETSSPQRAARALSQALSAEAQRANVTRRGGCSFVGEIIDLNQLEQYAVLLGPAIIRYGLAVRPLNDAKGPRLAMMMLLEGADCRR